MNKKKEKKKLNKKKEEKRQKKEQEYKDMLSYSYTSYEPRKYIPYVPRGTESYIRVDYARLFFNDEPQQIKYNKLIVNLRKTLTSLIYGTKFLGVNSEKPEVLNKLEIPQTDNIIDNIFQYCGIRKCPEEFKFETGWYTYLVEHFEALRRRDNRLLETKKGIDALSNNDKYKQMLTDSYSSYFKNYEYYVAPGTPGTPIYKWYNIIQYEIVNFVIDTECNLEYNKLIENIRKIVNNIGICDDIISILFQYCGIRSICEEFSYYKLFN